MLSLKQRAELARLKKKYKYELERDKNYLANESDINLLKILLVLELDHILTDSIRDVCETLKDDKEAYGMLSLVMAKSIASLSKIVKKNDKKYAQSTLTKSAAIILNEMEEIENGK